jgi:hypothetical protein
MSGEGLFGWMMILAVSGPFLWLIISTLAENWRKMKESEQLTLLKQSMIERGMTVEEMERILEIGGKPRKKKAEVTDKMPDSAQEQFRAG